MKRTDIISFFLISLLLSLPAGYEPDHFAKVLFAGAFIQSLVYGFVLTWLVRTSVRLRRLVVSIVYILFCFESFIFFRFGSRLDPNILTLMLQTNVGEVKEFLSVYIATPFTLFFCIVAVSCYVIICRLLGDSAIVRWDNREGRPLWLIAMLVTVGGMLVRYLPLPFPIGENAVNRLVTSIDFVKDRHAEIEKMEEAIDSIVVTRSPEMEESPVIVVVIGESFNKYHSSLYGYGLPTSPRLEKERESNHLMCYSSAMSPTNGTDVAMRLIFTLKGCEEDDSASLCPFVLMPAVFRKAGYRVAYFDNQYTRSSGGSLDYSCGYFLNPSYINDHCFDFRNSEVCSYDGDFIDLYREDFLKGNKSLDIIHLKGQHFDAALRFPSQFSVFGQGDIKRTDLSEKERLRVADYDNATLYNDYVLGMIIDEFREENAIIIYFSDHGEHIYDGGKQYYGRGFGSKYEEETVKAVYEVPFMIWCSDGFIARNSSMYAAIRETVECPICTADLPYLLFDIAGIEFNYHDRSRSVINRDFRPHEVRF